MADLLPEIPVLKRRMQSLAMLDAILSPEWEYRYYSFNAAWAPGETMGSMRNGQGDEFFILFSDAGAFLKGFDHEAAIEGVGADTFYAQLPPAFAEQAHEPAFSPHDVTFCYWRGVSDGEWHRAVVSAYQASRDGSGELLAILHGEAEGYLEFARTYYERELPAAAVASIFAQEPLTPTLAHSLNPAADWQELPADGAEIGYPGGGDRSGFS